ncbi:MAG: endopeptidase La [Pseudomonadota bacterium]|uniref:endopeptidase La n=1 Tax=Candidatus Desulfatibia profunda TaxID=2841695 RepID=A0A8J6NMR2_9BACT|nr:endopeptidase La [Candidatus Desulfatibia profunda]MBL7178592.1 endopeptidase La [Desulfobacterales bacterium]
MRIFKKGPEKGTPSEIEELKEVVLGLKMPEPVQKVALKEIERLMKTSPASAEYTIGINYLDYLVSLPWNRMTEDNLDIERAESILNQEHYGLTKIKDRILDHLAVRILKMSRKHRILVVDDEEMTRRNLEHVFQKDGYHVDTAASGVEALNLLEKSAYDVIVTDLKMEKVDGMDVLGQAKAKDPNTEVIIITGYATVTTAIEAMKKGSYHFLAKPLKLAEIRSTIKTALFKKMVRLEPKGPVLCFAGPPGTGKTSLGMSIARSLERKFIRISLAGMKDEAEIRGHRKSYVGALPGRIIQEIRRAESKNPVMMLDEIDKIGQDFKGDPASALLEVLDPEQNANFVDHYLDVPFDLSKVMFITTANTVDLIPGPLLDRLEVIYLSGYTEEEKVQIAARYLVSKEIEEAGLVEDPAVFTTEAIHKIIREYTREAGLRNLQRQIASICRKTARKALKSGRQNISSPITPETVEQLLGPGKYHLEVVDDKGRIGVATGLAWTAAGGEIIFIEAVKMKGKSRLTLTGSLGDVMKESAQAALSYIRSHTELLNIPESMFDEYDIHIHVPAGSIPKDGPSAGLTIAVALISLLTGRPCKRETALTGEMTLSGRLLPVGGVKEKVLAAHRAGVKSVVFPAKNEADIKDIPDDIKKDLKIITTDELAEIVDLVLE